VEEPVECGIDLVRCLLLRVMPGGYDDVPRDIAGIQRLGLPWIEVLLDVAFVPPIAPARGR
jgi:hypothetical protein